MPNLKLHTNTSYEFQMFESTNWVLEEPEIDDNSKFDLIFPTVVRPFSSTCQADAVSYFYYLLFLVSFSFALCFYLIHPAIFFFNSLLWKLVLFVSFHFLQVSKG